jgi:predicted NAD/FAD-binding protein
MRIAIVGGGISGLVAAHRLHPEHELTLYEAADRLGGHTNTVRVDLPDETHEIDTGFIVFNDRNYPAFEALLAELGVATQPSQMSFSVSDQAGDFEYAGTPRGLFAKPRHLVDRRFLRMIADLRRFNREARALLESPPAQTPSLQEFLRAGGYSDWFVERLIVPQASAVWSADPAQMWSFPAGFLARFFHNHGMLGLRDRPQWRTVVGGSRRYVEAVAQPLGGRIRLAAPVQRIVRDAQGVEIWAQDCETERFDEVVIAAHSDQALAMLGDPSALETELLGAIAYQRNEAVLHTDERLLPRRRAAWASWNFHLEDEASGSRDSAGMAHPSHTQLTYWMNNLQSLSSSTDFCVTLNRSEQIDPAKVIRTIDYAHPVYTPAGVAAQDRHHEISGVNRTHYCGAYWRWGFHEDGVQSALMALERAGRAAVAA